MLVRIIYSLSQLYLLIITLMEKLHAYHVLYLLGLSKADRCAEMSCSLIDSAPCTFKQSSEEFIDESDTIVIGGIKVRRL